MKFTLNGQTSVKASSTFDFRKAEIELSACLSRVGDAYEELVAKEGRCAEAEKCISDITFATESFMRFGVTATTVAIFNGKNRALDSALGMETMSKEAMESLGNEAKKVLKSKYLKALEDASDQTKQTFFQRVKEWWEKFVTWLKELFTGTAKLVKMIEESKFDDIDVSKKINGLTYDDAKAATDAMQAALDFLQNQITSASMAVGATKGTEAPDLQKKAGTIQELGWDVDKAKTMADKFVALVKDNKMKAAWDGIQKEYAQEFANTGDPSLYAKYKERFEVWRQAGKMTSGFNRMARQVGFTLYTISKAKKGSGESSPAENAAAAAGNAPEAK